MFYSSVLVYVCAFLSQREESVCRRQEEELVHHVSEMFHYHLLSFPAKISCWILKILQLVFSELKPVFSGHTKCCVWHMHWCRGMRGRALWTSYTDFLSSCSSFMLKYQPTSKKLRERRKKMLFPPKVERMKKASPMCSSEFIPQTISEAETVTLDLTPGLYFLSECYLKRQTRN